MEHGRHMKNKNWYGAAGVLCLLLAVLLTMPGLYARYTSGSGTGDAARAAIFGHSETITLPTEWTSILVPGESGTYTLTVSNANEEKVSEVAQKYNLEVLTAGNLPLEFQLTKDGTVIGSFAESQTDAGYTFQNGDMHFEPGTKEEHIYQLTVSWPQEKKDAALAEIPDFIEIHINAEQAD